MVNLWSSKNLLFVPSGTCTPPPLEWDIRHVCVHEAPKYSCTRTTRRQVEEAQWMEAARVEWWARRWKWRAPPAPLRRDAAEGSRRNPRAQWGGVCRRRPLTTDCVNWRMYKQRTGELGWRQFFYDHRSINYSNFNTRQIHLQLPQNISALIALIETFFQFWNLLLCMFVCLFAPLVKGVDRFREK